MKTCLFEKTLVLIMIRATHSEKGCVNLLLDSKPETVNSLKDKCTAAIGGKPVYYKLLLRDQELTDMDSTLESCSIADHDEITIRDSQFPLTIQGPYPLCEITNMYVTRTTTISTIKDNIMKTYNYGTVNEFDIVLNGRLLVKESVEKNQIGSSDVIVVAERIVTRLEPIRKKSSQTEIRPALSPVLSKKSSQSNFDRMMDDLINLFSDNSMDTKKMRSQSMPELVGHEDEEIAPKEDTSPKSRKISVPVKMLSMKV